MSSKSTIKGFHTLALDNVKVTVHYGPVVGCKYIAWKEAVADPVGVFRNPALPDY